MLRSGTVASAGAFSCSCSRPATGKSLGKRRATISCSFCVVTLTLLGMDLPEHPDAAKPRPTAATNNQKRRFITTTSSVKILSDKGFAA